MPLTCQLQESCTRLNKLKVYKDTTLHTITELCTEWFSVCTNMNSEFRLVTKFKSVVKENEGSYKTSRYDHPWWPMYQTLNAAVHDISQQNKILVLTFNCLSSLYFWVFTKMVLLKDVHPLKVYQHTKLHGPTLT
jgi:hypothetical protein